MASTHKPDEIDLWAEIDRIEAARAALRGDHGALIARLRAGCATVEDQRRVADMLIAAADLMDEQVDAEEERRLDEEEHDGEAEEKLQPWWQRY